MVTFLRDQLGQHVVRARQEGQFDRGDIGGLPDVVVQVKNYSDFPPGMRRAMRDGLHDLAEQKQNSGLMWGAAFIRRPGGRYAVAMDWEDWVSLYREAYLGGQRPRGK